MDESLRVEVDGGVALLTIDRQERRNALSATVIAELRAAVAAASDDPAVRVVAADDAQFGTPETDVGLWPHVSTVPLTGSMPPEKAGRTASESLPLLHALLSLTAGTEEAAEGMAALAGRRPPSWRVGAP